MNECQAYNAAMEEAKRLQKKYFAVLYFDQASYGYELSDDCKDFQGCMNDSVTAVYEADTGYQIIER